MSYYKTQLKKALLLRNEVFSDAGNGIFKNKSWAFVLNNAKLNLHPSICNDAIEYFKTSKIPFWYGVENGPTGHLLSSQVACLNHLFFLKDKPAIATAVLQSVDNLVEQALPLTENGYVDFEVVGKKNYLGEKSHSRGANSTSIDAVMLGQLRDGTRKLYFIEWKYTESYTSASKADGPSGETRLAIYTPFLTSPDCPIIFKDVKALFVEPYYQLMRQTLLANEMIKANEYEATDFLHIHAIPKNNLNLKAKNTSPLLAGNDLNSAWKAVLKQPERYKAIDPETLLKPALDFKEVDAITDYLHKRYWEETFG